MGLESARIAGWTAGIILLLGGCARNAETYVSKGNQLYAAGKYGDAEINYRKAIQTQRNNSEAYYQLGLTYLKEGKRLEAENALITAANGKPPVPGAKSQLADLRLEEYVADPQHASKLRDYLQQTADEVLARDPRSLDGLRIRGTLAPIDQRPSQALEVFRAANEIAPFQREIVHGLMLALALTGQTAEAEKSGLALLDKDKAASQAYEDLFAIYQATGRTVQAEQILHARLVNNPSVSAYRLALAEYYHSAGRRIEMETALAPLHSDRKTFPNGRLEEGEFYERMGLWKEAGAVFDEIAHTDPAQRLLAEKRGIQALVGAGRQAEAMALAERTEKGFPKDKEIRFIRASLAVDRQDAAVSADAVRELEQMRADHEREPMYWYVLGQAYRRSGKNEKALAAFQKAVRRNKGFEPALAALAELNLAGTWLCAMPKRPWLSIPPTSESNCCAHEGSRWPAAPVKPGRNWHPSERGPRNSKAHS